MDTSALEKAISSLENSSESLDSWLKFWTVLTVIGVAIAIIVILKEYRTAYKAWLRGSIRSPEKPTVRMLIIQLIGPVLVTVGVVGELWISILSAKINTGLRNNNNILVGLIHKQAGNAGKMAGEARERAAKIENENIRLRGQLAGLERNVAKQQERAAIAEKDLVKLREKIADRHLTPEQQSRIAKSICRFGGIAVDIGKYSSNAEIEELAKEIKGALPKMCDGNPGFEVSFFQWGARAPGFSGIQIIITEDMSKKSKTFADVLAAALKQEGLQVEGPMLNPTRGRIRLGGSDISASIGAGIEPGTPVEIAIGKKP